MTTADVDVIGAKLDALVKSFESWQENNCREHKTRIKEIEDTLIVLRLANASGKKMMLAAFFGALIPCVGLIVAMLRIMGKG
jgi:hypothetical protein